MISGFFSNVFSGVSSDMFPDVFSSVFSGEFSNMFSVVFSIVFFGEFSNMFSDVLAGVLAGDFSFFAPLDARSSLSDMTQRFLKPAVIPIKSPIIVSQGLVESFLSSHRPKASPKNMDRTTAKPMEEAVASKLACRNLPPSSFESFSFFLPLNFATDASLK